MQHPHQNWIKEYYIAIYKFIAPRVRSKEDAQELTQEVFGAASRKKGDLQDDTKIASWLYSIARNKIIDYYRAGRPETPTAADQLDSVAIHQIEPAEAPIPNSDVAHCLHAILDFMPPKYAAAMRLTDIEGHTFQEAATLMKISVPGAKSRSQRGRVMLREMIEECCTLEFDSYGSISDSCHKSHTCRFCPHDSA